MVLQSNFRTGMDIATPPSLPKFDKKEAIPPVVVEKPEEITSPSGGKKSKIAFIAVSTTTHSIYDL